MYVVTSKEKVSCADANELRMFVSRSRCVCMSRPTEKDTMQTNSTRNLTRSWDARQHRFSVILAQFTLKICVAAAAAWNREKITKTCCIGIERHSRS